jgi:hypothetical protein
VGDPPVRHAALGLEQGLESNITGPHDAFAAKALQPLIVRMKLISSDIPSKHYHNKCS